MNVIFFFGSTSNTPIRFEIIIDRLCIIYLLPFGCRELRNLSILIVCIENFRASTGMVRYRRYRRKEY